MKKPAVAYPALFSASETNVPRNGGGILLPTASVRDQSRSSQIPCTEIGNPVSMLTCAGNVQDVVETARSKTTPSRAKRSRFGDVSRG